MNRAVARRPQVIAGQQRPSRDGSLLGRPSLRVTVLGMTLGERAVMFSASPNFCFGAQGCRKAGLLAALSLGRMPSIAAGMPQPPVRRWQRSVAPTRILRHRAHWGTETGQRGQEQQAESVAQGSRWPILVQRGRRGSWSMGRAFGPCRRFKATAPAPALDAQEKGGRARKLIRNPRPLPWGAGVPKARSY